MKTQQYNGTRMVEDSYLKQKQRELLLKKYATDEQRYAANYSMEEASNETNPITGKSYTVPVSELRSDTLSEVFAYTKHLAGMSKDPEYFYHMYAPRESDFRFYAQERVRKVLEIDPEAKVSYAMSQKGVHAVLLDAEHEISRRAAAEAERIPYINNDLDSLILKKSKLNYIIKNPKCIWCNDKGCKFCKPYKEYFKIIDSDIKKK